MKALLHTFGGRSDKPRAVSGRRGGSAAAEAQEHRIVCLNDEQLYLFEPNAVRTSKYTVLSFLPLFLWESFHPLQKAANFYFLCISGLQMVPQITNTFGIPTMLFSLSMVVFVDAVFQIMEDARRHRDDYELNFNAMTERVEIDGGTRAMTWASVSVGDIICVRNNEQVPADLVLLSVGGAPGNHGICHIETKDLDGETNLKVRTAVAATKGMQPQKLRQLPGYVVLEHPNTVIDSFHGSIDFSGCGGSGGGGGAGSMRDSDRDPSIGLSSSKASSRKEFDGARLSSSLFSINSQRMIRAAYPKRFRGNVEDDESSYHGSMEMEKSENSMHGTALPQDPVILTTKNVMLRGVTLRNTDCIYGVVVNTGCDTKIMMSSLARTAKQSRLEEDVNGQLVSMILLLLAMSCLGATGDVLFQMHMSSNMWYLFPDLERRNGTVPVLHVSEDALNPTAAQSAEAWLVHFAYYFLLLSNVVPISLYVSMTIIKFFQKYFMERDLTMFDAESGTLCSVRSMSLNEELGQVSHVLSDKTGTLTCNTLDFRKCCIGAKSYGLGSTSIGRAVGLARRGTQAFREDSEDEHNLKALEHSQPHVLFHDPDFWDDRDGADAQSASIARFLNTLALCHSVIPERSASDGSIAYSASSPDDEALVCAAKFLGTTLFEIDSPDATLVRSSDGKRFKFRMLEMLEFSSARKRMSVVVQEPFAGAFDGLSEVVDARPSAASSRESRASDSSAGGSATTGLSSALTGSSGKVTGGDGRILLLSKGADVEIFRRLASGDRRVLEANEKALKRFSEEGLRTLCFAYKQLDEDAFHLWKTKYRRALRSRAEVKKRERGERNRIDRLMDELERDLTLVGSSGIEDRLQEGVPDTIASLKAAGIGVWVLTGDKQETAVNIGIACSLLSSRHSCIMLDSATCLSADDTLDLMQRQLDAMTTSGECLPAMPMDYGYDLDDSPRRISGPMRRRSVSSVDLRRMSFDQMRSSNDSAAKAQSTNDGDTHTSGGLSCDTEHLIGSEKADDEEDRPVAVAAAVSSSSFLPGMSYSPQLILDTAFRRRTALESLFRSTSDEMRASDADHGPKSTISFRQSAVERHLRRSTSVSAADVNTAAAIPRRAQLESFEQPNSPGHARGLARDEGVRGTSAGSSVGKQPSLSSLRPAHSTASVPYAASQPAAHSGGSTMPIAYTNGSIHIPWVTVRTQNLTPRASRASHSSRRSTAARLSAAIFGTRRHTMSQALSEPTYGSSLPLSTTDGSYFGGGTPKMDLRPNARAGKSSTGLVIDGPTLARILGDEEMEGVFSDLAQLCEAVIVCRATPSQKRLVAELVVKFVPSSRTLAIGDGANDVPMLLSAHVGVGIAGAEGRQAVNASDFAIAQFRFLVPLLFEQGRSNYLRMARVALYIFYKNVLMCTCMFLYACFAGMSGQKVFSEGAIQFYNIVYTGLPIIIFGCWDRDIARSDARAFPFLYYPCIKSVAFNGLIFRLWIFEAIFQAGMLSGGPWLFMGRGSYFATGHELGVWVYGTIIFTLVIITATAKLAFFQSTWTALQILALPCGLLGWFVIMPVYERILLLDYDYYLAFTATISDPEVWLLVVITAALVVLKDVWTIGFKRAFHPRSHQIVQELTSADEVVSRKAKDVLRGYARESRRLRRQLERMEQSMRRPSRDSRASRASRHTTSTRSTRFSFMPQLIDHVFGLSRASNVSASSTRPSGITSIGEMIAASRRKRSMSPAQVSPLLPGPQAAGRRRSAGTVGKPRRRSSLSSVALPQSAAHPGMVEAKEDDASVERRKSYGFMYQNDPVAQGAARKRILGIGRETESMEEEEGFGAARPQSAMLEDAPMDAEAAEQ